jgi:hypothetical protein
MMAEAKTKAPEQSIDMEALKAELRAELKAELKEELKPEPVCAAPAKQTRPGPDPWLEEYVSVQLFKDGKDYKDDVYVSVNGENCRIQRGVPVKIKRKFALVLEQSQAQDIRAAEFAEAKQSEYSQQVRRFNI